MTNDDDDYEKRRQKEMLRQIQNILENVGKIAEHVRFREVDFSDDSVFYNTVDCWEYDEDVIEINFLTPLSGPIMEIRLKEKELDKFIVEYVGRKTTKEINDLIFRINERDKELREGMDR